MKLPGHLVLFTRAKGKVHIHDLRATMLHLLGLDHNPLTYRIATAVAIGHSWI